jgi:hypothetical protein
MRTYNNRNMYDGYLTDAHISVIRTIWFIN